MALERYTLTRAGYDQLQRELTDYQERRAQQQIEMESIQDNTTENYPEEGAEFEARTMREIMDERIGNLILILQQADVTDEDPNPRTIDPGDRVTAWNVQDREEVEFDLVGSAEVMYGREGVSIESPVGQALIGRRVGDVVDVATPDGMTRYAIRRVVRTPDHG
ncbi:MAG: GreA/GreB family elongation factor [Chloroflexota bacterium]|nr:GreA/GreB family elongation factor [Chloroflexota bacterium]